MFKNWYRLFYIIFCIAGIGLYITLLCIIPKDETLDASLVCFLLGPISFFVGTLVYNVLKFFKNCNTAAAYVQTISALCATVLLSIGANAIYKSMGVANTIALIYQQTITADGEIISRELAQWYSLVFVTAAYFGQLIAFGFMPLVKGISKTLAVTPEYKRENDPAAQLVKPIAPIKAKTETGPKK
jgi:hypothetical protein